MKRKFVITKKKTKGTSVESLGSYLKKEREARNCSLDEISCSTKIRKGILAAIERDDYSLLPSQVYVMGFLRAYATHLGLDGDEVMKRYQEIAGKAEEEVEEKKEKRDGSFLKKPAGVIAAAVVLVLLLYLIALRPSSTVEKKAKVASPPATVLPDKQKVEVPVESIPEPDTVVKEGTPSIVSQTGIGAAIAEGGEAKRLNLLCKAKERTWMRITLDELQPSEIMLRAGDNYEVKADQVIRLKIGNAGGVDLSLNGKILPSPGKSGEVVSLTLGGSDPPQRITP